MVGSMTIPHQRPTSCGPGDRDQLGPLPFGGGLEVMVAAGLIVILVGYMFFDRGFAHLHLPVRFPLHVSEMGERGRERGRRSFTWEKKAEELERIHSRVAVGSHS